MPSEDVPTSFAPNQSAISNIGQVFATLFELTHLGDVFVHQHHKQPGKVVRHRHEFKERSAKSTKEARDAFTKKFQEIRDRASAFASMLDCKTITQQYVGELCRKM